MRPAEIQSGLYAFTVGMLCGMNYPFVTAWLASITIVLGTHLVSNALGAKR